jgi:signal transduction histidine kinase
MRRPEPGAGPALVRGVVLLGGLVVLSAAGLAAPLPDDQEGALLPWLATALLMGVLVLGVYLMCRRVVAYVRGQTIREAALSEAARREGAMLVANTIRHHVCNKLAVTIGYSELLADNPRLPRQLRAAAQKVLSSARAAADAVHQLTDQPLERLPLDTSVAGPSLLDLSAQRSPPRDPASTAPAVGDGHPPSALPPKAG